MSGESVGLELCGNESLRGVESEGDESAGAFVADSAALDGPEFKVVAGAHEVEVGGDFEGEIVVGVALHLGGYPDVVAGGVDDFDAWAYAALSGDGVAWRGCD